MHVEITRMITGWLAHKEYGVNGQLVDVPRNKVGSGTDEKPATVKIYNDVDYDIVSVAGVDPPETPSIVVVADVGPKGADIGQQRKSAHEFTAVVGVGYYAEEIERARTVRDGNYVSMAIMHSLLLWNESPDRSKGFRDLNRIRLMLMTGVTIQRVAGAIPPSRLLGMVIADFKLMYKFH